MKYRKDEEAKRTTSKLQEQVEYCCRPQDGCPLLNTNVHRASLGQVDLAFTRKALKCTDNNGDNLHTLDLLSQTGNVLQKAQSSWYFVIFLWIRSRQLLPMEAAGNGELSE